MAQAHEIDLTPDYDTIRYAMQESMNGNVTRLRTLKRSAIQNGERAPMGMQLGAAKELRAFVGYHAVAVACGGTAQQLRALDENMSAVLALYDAIMEMAVEELELA